MGLLKKIIKICCGHRAFNPQLPEPARSRSGSFGFLSSSFQRANLRVSLRAGRETNDVVTAVVLRCAVLPRAEGAAMCCTLPAAPSSSIGLPGYGCALSTCVPQGSVGARGQPGGPGFKGYAGHRGARGAAGAPGKPGQQVRCGICGETEARGGKAGVAPGSLGEQHEP